jgi:hypothetical protein
MQRWILILLMWGSTVAHGEWTPPAHPNPGEILEEAVADLVALEGVRDEAEAKVRSGAGGFNDFNDVSSINEYLGSDTATTELFLWLDKNNNSLAKKTYSIAQPALVASREYAVCGKYIDSRAVTQWLLLAYRENVSLVKDGNYGSDLQEFGQKTLTNGASTLVALLVLNNRKAEADAVMKTVLEEWPDEKFRKELEQAKKGIVPPRWPSVDGGPLL